MPALNQLLLPLLSLVSVAELSRNPTVKAETAAAGDRSGRSSRRETPGQALAELIARSEGR